MNEATKTPNQAGPANPAPLVQAERLVMHNKVYVGDVLEPLNLSEGEKKELITKMVAAMEKRILADASKMLYGSGAPQKWTDFPPKKQGPCYGITICCA